MEIIIINEDKNLSFVFGRTTIGTSNGDLGNNIVGSGFVCPQSGWAESITVYLGNVPAKVKAALFRVSDLSFVAVTEEIIPTTLPGLYKLMFPTPPLLEVNVKYYPVAWSDGDLTCAFDSDYPDVDSIVQGLPYGEFPPYLTPDARPRWVMSIYCTVLTAPPPPTHNLTIQALVGGITNPSSGTYAYTEGSNVEVTAIAGSGYVFDHWELDGVNIGNVNPTTVTIDADHTLLAVFAAIPAPPTHALTVNSTPIQGVAFMIERVS